VDGGQQRFCKQVDVGSDYLGRKSAVAGEDGLPVGRRNRVVLQNGVQASDSDRGPAKNLDK
jgi:hypothetical protein